MNRPTVLFALNRPILSYYKVDSYEVPAGSRGWRRALQRLALWLARKVGCTKHLEYKCQEVRVETQGLGKDIREGIMEQIQTLRARGVEPVWLIVGQDHFSKLMDEYSALLFKRDGGSTPIEDGNECFESMAVADEVMRSCLKRTDVEKFLPYQSLPRDKVNVGYDPRDGRTLVTRIFGLTVVLVPWIQGMFAMEDPYRRPTVRNVAPEPVALEEDDY